MVHVADVFFIIFHSTLILFNLFGWIWKKTRRLNLITLLLTGASWFILGIFYGIGFCPFTEWHWRILEKLGQTALPDSYITYLIWRMTGWMPDGRLVDILTVVLFFLALILSVILNIHTLKKKKT